MDSSHLNLIQSEMNQPVILNLYAFSLGNTKDILKHVSGFIFVPYNEVSGVQTFVFCIYIFP